MGGRGQVRVGIHQTCELVGDVDGGRGWGGMLMGGELAKGVVDVGQVVGGVVHERRGR